MDEPIDHAGQVLHADRLADVLIHARLQAPLPVPGHRVGGHRDDGDPLPRRLALADHLGRLKAIHHRHLQVHKHQIVGDRGEGWMVANAILGHERDSLGNPNITLTRLNALIELMKTETVSGERMIDNPVYRDRLMQIQGRVMAMRFNELRVLSSRLNKGQDAGLARMITKLQGTELRHDLEGLAIDIMGEVGLSYGDNPHTRSAGSWQSQYMYFLGLIIGGGTSQIQKNIISERGLEMPREPKVEKK